MTPPPINLDNNDLSGATVDGQDVKEITVDGQTVFQSDIDISNISFEGRYYPGPYNPEFPNNLAVTGDGTSMYVTAFNETDIFEHTMSTPFDVSSASFHDKHTTSGPGGIEPRDFFFSPDGTSMFELVDEYKIFTHDLSTPYDLNTRHNTAAINIDGREPQLLTSVDGTVVSPGNGYIRERYDLSVGFDGNTATETYTTEYTNWGLQKPDADGRGRDITDMEFSKSGNKLFGIASDVDPYPYIFEAELQSQYEWREATVTKTRRLNNIEDCDGFFISRKGQMIYVVGDGDGYQEPRYINQYSF